MSQKEIGRVRLSKGRVGYFDELTRIHLTISRPEAAVYSSMNTKNLKRAVHGGVLRLVSGSLELDQPKVVKDLHTTDATKKAAEKSAEPVVVTIEPAVEPVKEAEVEETVKETVVEEPTAEAPAKETVEQAAEVEAEAVAKTVEEDKEAEVTGLVEETKPAPVSKTKRKTTSK